MFPGASVRLATSLLQSIPAHQEKARKTSMRFNDLVNDVEAFPSRVTAYLAKAESEESAGFWNTIWNGIKQFVTPFLSSQRAALTQILGKLGFAQLSGGCVPPINHTGLCSKRSARRHYNAFSRRLLQPSAGCLIGYNASNAVLVIPFRRVVCPLPLTLSALLSNVFCHHRHV